MQVGFTAVLHGNGRKTASRQYARISFFYFYFTVLCSWDAGHARENVVLLPKKPKFVSVVFTCFALSFVILVVSF